MSINIFALEPDTIKEHLQGYFPDYRFNQLCDCLFKKLHFDPRMASNLPKDMIDFLEQEYSFKLPSIAHTTKAKDGTTKFLLNLDDQNKIEMVLIPTAKKRTLCVSSQVGCARLCSFCATGTMGFKRNLETHEIVGQIMHAAKICYPERLSNLVFMGMGEPMDNLLNVLQSLRVIQSDSGLAFSPSGTTVSTCGIPEGIVKLADSRIKTKLAVSLNSAIDNCRSLLMPINRIYPLKELKQALRYFLSKTTFRITFEYILIPEINMGIEDIKALKTFVGDLSCKINFIPYNTVPQLPYRSPTEKEIEIFLNLAQNIHQAITLRRSRGAEVFGACGQLAIHKGESL